MLRESLASCEKHYQEEVERAEKNNAWAMAFRQSFKP